MIRRILGSWTHWRIGEKYHLGFYPRQAWRRLLAMPTVTRYPTVTFVSWWRVFVAFDGLRKRGKS